MRWFIIKIGLALILSLLICEASTFVYYLNPNTKNIYLDNLYLNKKYKQPITVLYYLYELMPYLKDLIWAVIAYKMATIISFRLSQVFLIFIIYYIVQVFFYVWDRNTSFLRNYALYTVISFVILEMALPDKKFSGIYRNFNDY